MRTWGSFIATAATVAVACLAASCGSSNGNPAAADSSTADTASSSPSTDGSGSEAGPEGARGGDSRPTTCASPDDCLALGSSVCCAASACALVWDVVNQLSHSSNYSESCESDTDCLALEQGDGCVVVAKPQTTSCTTSFCGAADGGRVQGPCCIGGTCQEGSQCQGPRPSGDAAADASGAGDAGDAGSQ